MPLQTPAPSNVAETHVTNSVVHLIILPRLIWVNLNELDVSVKSHELLMSTGCSVGLITPLFQKQRNFLRP